MLARTSLRTAFPSLRTSVVAARRAYSTPAAEKTAEKVEVAKDEVVKKVQELEAQVKELKSQLTYGKADFINLQRRSEQEKSSTKDFAIQGFASDLLATVDILTTALKYVPQPIPSENKALTSLFSGVEMTKQELLKTFAKHGITQFDPTGEKFDPNRHEALLQAPIPGKEPGTVLECQKTGFMIKTRTLRPAQVGVVQDLS
ncbi:hypothetical protein QFC20_002850 [Naganishia adeliensis]|uniref:Uncharacterized protein n=1 Tax=Naganishia adeliensis TaxID=92952 RepID=A0ACC2WIY6_9TREE|nr:hypothetical protein QFC20_002850 [Naganishia adeliensis]